MSSWINKEKALMKRIKGGAGEACFKNEMESQGKKVNRTGVGSDYEVDGEYYEIKTGHSAQPTKRQREEIKKGKVKLRRINFDY